jgi:hypothetical protein
VVLKDIFLPAPIKGTKTMGLKGTLYRCITIACPHSWKNIKPTIPTAYGHPKNSAYVPEVRSIDASGAAFVNFRATRTYFIFPNKIEAPIPIDAIVPILDEAFTGDRPSGWGVFLSRLNLDE